MDEPKKSSASLGWVVIVILLMAGIDGLLTRVLETFWVSLRDKGSPAYLQLEWWMSAPFTVFVFAVLSALLTSFSGLKNWLKAFVLLCFSKAVFVGVTAAFFHLKTYPDLTEAALRASFLSLPSVLVHILMSGMVIMFLRDLLGIQPEAREGAIPHAAAEEKEEWAVSVGESPAEVMKQVAVAEAPVGEYEGSAPMGPFVPAEVAEAPEAPAALAEEKDRVLIPVGEILKFFPEGELAMSPEEIEEISPSVAIPLEVVLPQLSEGRVVVDVMTVISGIAPDAFLHPPEEVARKFPDGEIELPLGEVVRRLPAEIFQLPQQDFQPDIEEEFPDFFQAPSGPPIVIAEKPAGAVKERKREKMLPPQRVFEPAEALPDEAFVVREEERLLFERSRQVVHLNTESIISQFPEGSVLSENLDRLPRLPDTVVVPMELILPQLARGEVKLKGKFVLAQFPEGRISISEADIIRSLRSGEVILPLREIVPQLPPEVLAPPKQEQQPILEEMPNPFNELPRSQVVGEARIPAAAQKPQPKPTPIPFREKKAPAPSFAEELRREANPLSLSLGAVVRLLPEGAFRVSKEELAMHLGGETVKVPRSMVVAQLKEGRVVVPVELLTAQFPPGCLSMSVEQVKSRFAEGLAELPLQEMVSQVFAEVLERPADQKLQPACEEISSPFEEIPHEVRGEPAVAVAEPGGEVASGELVSRSASARVGVKSQVQTCAERHIEVGVAPQKQEAVPRTAGTILRNLIQKCQGLGISEHAALSVADTSVVLLTPPNLNSEILAAEVVGLWAQGQKFCSDHGLGEPFKIAVSARNGMVVTREMVRGDARRLMVLGSFNRNGAGFTSLLFDKLDTELRDLLSLMEVDLKARPVARSARPEGEATPLKPDGVPEEVCQQVVATLAEAGIGSYLSTSTSPGQRLVIVWGEGDYVDSFLKAGIFDLESLSRRSEYAGLGEFQSLLLVSGDAKVTLNRSSVPRGKNPSAYLLCIFPANCGEGLVRTKAARAVELIGR